MLTSATAPAENRVISQIDSCIIVGGAGPVGLYAAFRLLRDSDLSVVVFESRGNRSFSRPQVVCTPYLVAADLPQSVRDQLWVAETQCAIFAPITEQEQWPRPQTNRYPFLNTGSFQSALHKYLEDTYRDRYFFVPHGVNFVHSECEQARVDIDSLLEKLVECFPTISIDRAAVKGIVLSFGGYTHQARKHLGAEMLKGKQMEHKGHGINLCYKDTGVETYKRGDQILDRSALSPLGLALCASNTPEFHTQLCVYNTGAMQKVVEAMPESFKKRASYGSSAPVKFSGEGLSNVDKKWLYDFSEAVHQSIAIAGIKLPVDTNSIEMYYAQRGEYYYDKVVFMSTAKEGFTIPCWFIGNAAGSTDHMCGMGMGRGFLTARFLTDAVQRVGPLAASFQLQDYWSNVIQTEFNKESGLMMRPDMWFKYLVEGREVQVLGGPGVTYTAKLKDYYLAFASPVAAHCGQETEETASSVSSPGNFRGYMLAVWTIALLCFVTVLL